MRGIIFMGHLDGIIAGCEGDLQSIFSLLAVKALTGRTDLWQNQTMINSRTDRLILALPPRTQTNGDYIIRNHFETEKGIAMGLLQQEAITVHKMRR